MSGPSTHLAGPLVSLSKRVSPRPRDRRGQQGCDEKDAEEVQGARAKNNSNNKIEVNISGLGESRPAALPWGIFPGKSRFVWANTELRLWWGAGPWVWSTKPYNRI